VDKVVVCAVQNGSDLRVGVCDPVLVDLYLVALFAIDDFVASGNWASL
jgi:hypothetical protein